VTLALVGNNSPIRLCDVATGRIVRQWPETTRSARTITFSPNGKLLASTGDICKSGTQKTGKEGCAIAVACISALPGAPLSLQTVAPW